MYRFISIDTETTGLSPYKEDTAFGISIGLDEESLWLDVNEDNLAYVKRLILDNTTTPIFLHNAKFDMAFLDKLGVDLLGSDVHCTMAIARVMKFDLPSLAMSYLAVFVGEKKMDAVKEYCKTHKLWEWVQRPGKKKREKNFFFSLVPKEIISTYARMDAHITRKLGIYETNEIAKEGNQSLMNNEKRLTKTLFKMEKVGIKINRDFVERAMNHEKEIYEGVEREFSTITQIVFKDSNKCLSEAYEKEGYNYSLTEKGNPSFSADNIKTHDNDISRLIKIYRKSHTRAGTYESILHYSDRHDICHPIAKQSGCVTGRMSYADPPIQCLEKVEKDDEDYLNPYLIRRSFVPREGFIFVMMDFDQFEYRMMLNYAEEMDLIAKVKEGMDVHAATAEILGTTRKQAKTINFALLYGAGSDSLAGMLGVTTTESRALKEQYFRKLPKVKELIQGITTAVQKRGYIRNWAGRRYKLPWDLSFKAPNYLIQGGTADWIKVAMNKIDDYFIGKRSRMLLQIHDEILFEIHESEIHLIPTLRHMMENAVDNPLFQFLPFTVGIDYSRKSWQDKEPWTSA